MALVNTVWIDNLTAQVNAVPDCAALEQLVGAIQSVMEAQIQAAVDQIAALAPLQITVGNPTQVMEFVNALKGFYVTQYATAVAQQAALIAAYTDLLAALDAKKTALNCDTVIPTFP